MAKQFKSLAGLTIGKTGIEFDENKLNSATTIKEDNEPSYTTGRRSGGTGLRAPYNFVPFSNTVLYPYENTDKLPRHDVVYPEKKTGEIHVTLSAETPVLIGDGKADDSNKKEKSVHFFKNIKGQYTIPGSTVRGLLRENCQILGFGRLNAQKDFDDYHIIFRALASKDKILRDYYHNAIKTTIKTSDGQEKEGSKALAGYIYTEDGNNYRIYPVKNSDIKYIKRDIGGLDELKKIKVKYVDKGEEKERFKYSDGKGAMNEQIIPVKYTGTGDNISFTEGKAGESPVLLCTGRPVGDPNCHYLFPAFDRKAKYESVKEEDIIDFTADYEARQTVLKNKNFWKLPEKGKAKPIFYIEYEIENDNKVEKHFYFGMSRYLRIGYPYKISNGLSDSHIDNPSNTGKIDYPHAIFGSIDLPYKSRVSVGDFVICNENANESDGKPITPASPKPSWYYGYLEPKGRYIDNDFRLRGYKQYWLKEECIEDTGNKNAKTKVKIFPLEASKENPVKFKGVIRFTNLSDMELGLLLWAIRLNKNCYHTVGMGKAFGLGRMSAEIEKLNIQKKDLGYSNLSGSPWDDCTSQIDKFISDYDKNALALVNEEGSVSDKDEIQDFFYMKSKIRDVDEVSYMELKEFSNVTDWLPTVRDIRKKDINWSTKI